MRLQKKIKFGFYIPYNIILRNFNHSSTHQEGKLQSLFLVENLWLTTIIASWLSNFDSLDIACNNFHVVIESIFATLFLYILKQKEHFSFGVITMFLKEVKQVMLMFLFVITSLTLMWGCNFLSWQIRWFYRMKLDKVVSIGLPPRGWWIEGIMASNHFWKENMSLYSLPITL